MKKFSLIFLSIVSTILLTACAPETLLRVAVEEANMECPMQVDDIMTITSLEIEGQNVVSTCMVDEKKFSKTVEQLDNPESISQLKTAFLTNFRTSDEKREMRELCKKAGYNIIYRFVGTQTGHSIDIICQASEL